MQGLLSAIGLVFGKLMYFIYNTIGFQNYALSLVFFTIVYKLILLPLSVKQMKSSAKMQELQPELARIQARYKNDREKLNEETMKFYQEKGYNPSSGCLPLLIQLPIVIALFYVIRMPMSYMLEIPAKAVGEMAVVSVENGYIPYGNVGKETFDEIKGDPLEAYQQFSKKDYYFEIKLIDAMSKHPEIVDSNTTLSEQHKMVLKNFDLRMFHIFNLGVPPTYKIKDIVADPATNIPPLILLIFAVFTTVITASLTMPKPPETKGKDKKGANPGCTNSMLWISPLMTLWIGMTTPSGLSLYWTINNVLSFAQQKALTVFFNKDKKTESDIKNDKKKDDGKVEQTDQNDAGANKEENRVVKVNRKRSKKR